MNCHNCGGKLESTNTDLPFKIRQNSIIIFKQLPILQCENCNEYLIEDAVMEELDSIFDKIDTKAELEILNYAT